MASSARNAPATDSAGFAVDRRLQRSIIQRLDTFAEEFRDGRIGSMSVSDVADDGFSYDPATNAVRCAWCGASTADWQNIDSVSVLKQLHNNSCPRSPPVDEPHEWTPVAEDELEGATYNAEVDLQSSRGSSAPIHLLRRDNERMREQVTCKKCKRSQVETLFLPCRHLVACEACADQVEDCFMCDTKILGTVRIYME